MQHSFDTKIATEYGMAEAILLNNFAFWLTKKKANNQDCHGGYYWTYNSVKAFAELFPYLTANQVRRALEKLKKEGLLLAGNYNSNTYDRTLWYTLTEKAMELLGVDLKPDAEPFAEKDKSICQQSQIHLPKSAAKDAKSICPQAEIHLAKKTNGFGRNAEPIPDINTVYYDDDDNTPIPSFISRENANSKAINTKAINLTTVEVVPRESNNISSVKQDNNTKAQDIFALYGNNISPITPILAEKVQALIADYGEAAVKYGIEAAVEQGVRTYPYVLACAKNYLAESGREKRRRQKVNDVEGTIAEIIKELDEEGGDIWP